MIDFRENELEDRVGEIKSAVFDPVISPATLSHLYMFVCISICPQSLSLSLLLATRAHAHTQARTHILARIPAGSVAV